MKNFIILLYFVFLFKLTLAQSLPNMPGLESDIENDSASVPTLEQEENSDEFPAVPASTANPKKTIAWKNPDNVEPKISEENIPTIDLPENNTQTTKLPEPQIRQASSPQLPNTPDEKEINDPFPKSSEPVFGELEAEKPVAEKELNEENFPETPELDFSGKKLQEKKSARKAFTPEERERQVDALLNSVIGEDEEEKVSAEDLLSNENPEERTDEAVEYGHPTDFQDIRRRVGYQTHSYTEEQLVDQLVKAAMRGDRQTVVSLLHSGRKANSANRFGETPLMGAIYNGHADIVEVLVAEGADPNAKDAKGNTPLHVAVARRNYPAVQQLLRAGAIADARNMSNDTPLLIATLNNSLDIIDLLVREGADVNKSNGDGLTPLHIATYNNNIEIVKYLLYVGANANMINRDGLKPYDLAYGKNLDIARLLVSYTGPQRYVSNDLQNMIQQKNVPVVSPIPQQQVTDQYSMFPKTYVEAEQKADQEEQEMRERQADWWAAKKNAEVSATPVPDNSVYSEPARPRSQINSQVNSGNSMGISLDANEIRQPPQQAPASMRMNQIKSAPQNGADREAESDTNFAMGSIITPSQALTHLNGGTTKYSDMTPEERRNWDSKLERWIKIGENMSDMNPFDLKKFKKLGAILESVYQQQLGMNTEKIKRKIAYERYTMQVYGEKRRPANPDKMNFKTFVRNQDMASTKIDTYLKSIYQAQNSNDLVIEY